MYNLNDDLQEKKARVTNKQVINGYWSQKEYVGNLVIPSTITVDNEVYTVTCIDWECFTPSKNLTSVTIPSTVKSLAYGAFRDCTGLKSVTLPNTLESLEQFCFENCKRLGSITIPESVTTIDDACFSQCVSLTSIFMLPPTPPTTGSKVFLSVPLQTVYVVDENAKALYQAAAPWNQYRIVVMPTGIDNVQKDAPRITHLYDLSGKPLNGHQHGPVIVRYNDGSTHKVLLK